MRKHTKLLISLILSLCAFSSKGQNWVGSYKLKIDIKEQISPSTIRADISYDVQLPIDSNLIGLPMPFGNNKYLSFIIEPTSSANTVLFGYFRPENTCGFALIPCDKKPTKFFLTFKNVYLQTTPSSYSNDVFAINLIIDHATKKIKNYHQHISIPQLTEVLIYSNNFVNSIPSPLLADRQNEHRIILPQDFNSEENEVIIYASQEKKTISPILLIFLLTTGAIIGFLAAPKIATTFNKAILYGLLSLCFMIAVPVIVHYYISPIFQLQDSTTIVTFGTFMGLLVGLVIYSGKVILSYWPDISITKK
jgi:hypothetical protein